MAGYTLVCDGEVTSASDGAALCSSPWMVIPVADRFDLTKLDPAVCAQAFGVGFGSMVPVLVVVFGIRALYNMFQHKD